MMPTHRQEADFPLTPLQFYKALADEIRLKTLLLIFTEQELCVCELMAALAEDCQPKVSRHLAQLRKMGILTSRKHQQWVFYQINPTLPAWLGEIITNTCQQAPEFIQQEINRLKAFGGRPERIIECCTGA